MLGCSDNLQFFAISSAQFNLNMRTAEILLYYFAPDPSNVKLCTKTKILCKFVDVYIYNYLQDDNL